MSTKTTFKRVALVAVASMGFGVLTSVAPATAAVGATPTAVTVGTVPLAQVGVNNRTPITITVPLDATSDSIAVTVKVTSAPAGSAFASVLAVSQTNGSAGACTTIITGCIATGSTTAAKLTIADGITPGHGTVSVAQTTTTPIVASVGAIATAAGYVVTTYAASMKINIDMTPDIAGSYTIQVSARSAYTSGVIQTAAATAYAAGDANATYTVSTGAAVSSMTLAAVTAASTLSSDVGQLMSLTLKNASGTATSLGSGETVNITGAGSADSFMKVTVTSGAYVGNTTNTGTANATLGLTSADFLNGVAYFNLKNSAASTGLVITATGSGTLSSTITTALTTTVTTPSGGLAGVLTLGDSTARVGTRPGSGHSATASEAATASLTSTSHSFDVANTGGTAATDVVLDVKVVDTLGYITGITGQVYNRTLALVADTTTTTTSYGTLTISATCATAAACFTASLMASGGTWGGGSADAVTVTGAAAVATSNTLEQATTIRQNHGASTALSAVLKDQYAGVMANQTVTVVTTGRNATSSANNGVTDALGRTTYTRTDAGTSATASTQDVVTITSGGISGASVSTIIYATASAASTITCLTGNEDDTAATITYRDISSGTAAGATSGAASLCTVTIKDVNGSIITGVPVTVTTASAGAAVRSTSATLYTSSLGQVAPSVYGWTAGTKTFTITAGTVTKDVTVNYRQGGAAGTNHATEVRTISAVTTGNSIKVSALDRFGNPVSGVALFASRTGNGLFGGGANTNGQTTDTNGSAEFIFNAGSTASVVTITAGSATSAVVAYGQTSSVAGALCVGVDCTSAAFTAATVGTSTTAETGIGASLSPAGVGVVTVSFAAAAVDTTAADNASAATDAAAEATDAANAATDAANAAAEAADAATAAAQDAADAVAALATQVAELMADLKAQIAAQKAAITALTNLVIKIQKKIKA